MTPEELTERAHELAAHLTRVTVPEELQAQGFRFVFDDTPLSVPSEKAAPARRPEPYGFPWCLHKDPRSEEWDVTRYCDQARVMLQECGGIRTDDQ